MKATQELYVGFVSHQALLEIGTELKPTDELTSRVMACGCRLQVAENVEKRGLDITLIAPISIVPTNIQDYYLGADAASWAYKKKEAEISNAIKEVGWAKFRDNVTSPKKEKK